MNDQEFADKLFEKANNKGYQNTSHGNIKCPYGKNLSKHNLETIHQILGSKCPKATSVELNKAGIQPCCFDTFRQIAQLIYP